MNGQPGALAYDGDGLLLAVLALDVAEGRVQAIRSDQQPRFGTSGRSPSIGRPQAAGD